jgi:hypothetical protein
MEPKPVQDHKPPAYPTRREILAGAASFALAGLAGGALVFAASEDGKTLVAPIFEHGEGRASDGCMVVVPPIFLSEEEALRIVKEELAKNGIHLAPGTVLKELRVAPRRQQQIEDDEKTRKIVVDEENAKPLHVTGIDRKRSVAVEFICRKNYKTLGGIDSHSVDITDSAGERHGSTFSSVVDFDFKDAATHLAKEIHRKSQQRLYIGVFYDPLQRAPLASPPKKGEKIDRTAAREKRDKQSKAESAKELRQQAQDFVAWLKNQKAIQ